MSETSTVSNTAPQTPSLIVQANSIISNAFGAPTEMFEQNVAGYEYAGTIQQEIQALASSTLKATRRTETFYRLKDHFIIVASGYFYYYKLGTDVIRPGGKHLFRMKTRPRVLMEGMVVVNGLVYLVTVDDIRRGIVRKSRGLDLRRDTITYADFVAGDIYKVRALKKTTAKTDTDNTNQTGTDNDITGSSGAASFGNNPGSNSGNSNTTASDFTFRGSVLQTNASATSGNSSIFKAEKSDLVFEEQINSLLHTLSEEEGGEWEVTQGP